jgi:RHS repeat-associated protein
MGVPTTILITCQFTTSGYDGLDRLIRTLFPDSTTETLNYYVSGALCSTKDQPCVKQTRLATANTINFTYDPLDRVSTRSPAGLNTISFAYNLAGDIVSETNTTHTTGYGYDTAGRPASETNDNLPVSYMLDGNGNRTRTTWPDGYYVSYQYDTFNRMSFAWEGAVGTIQLASYTFDPLSRRSTLTYGANSSDAVSYFYEPDDALSSYTHQLGTASLTIGLTHNHSKQIRSLSASDSFYLPEPATNNTAYVPNNLNQYTQYSGTALGYDLAGNLTSWTAPEGNSQTYTYDVENLLRTVALNGSTTPSVTYDYDALGRRFSKNVSGVVTQYLLDGDEEIAEYDGSGNLLRRYVTGPATDDRIAQVDSSDNKTYFHVDHHGSVLAMTDPTGAITQQMSYDEYGNLSSGSVTTGQPFRYTGRRFDPETGLYYYRARYYSPVLGRFLQTDPAGNATCTPDPGGKTATCEVHSILDAIDVAARQLFATIYNAMSSSSSSDDPAPKPSSDDGTQE